MKPVFPRLQDKHGRASVALAKTSCVRYHVLNILIVTYTYTSIVYVNTLEVYVCQSIQVNCCAGPVHYLVDDTYLVQYMVDVHTTYSIHEIEQATHMITDQATNALNA